MNLRIAVILKGMPRFLEEGATWNNQKVFSESFKNKYNAQVDYFCHFWDDKSESLSDRIITSYSPKKYKIDNFDEYIVDFDKCVSDFYENNPHYKLFVPLHILSGITADSYFMGQYISTQLGVELIDNIDEYDVVFISRTDTLLLLNSSTTETADDILYRRLLNAKESYGIFPSSSSVDVQTGHTHLGDLYFISNPTYIKKYCYNLYQNLLNLITKDSFLFYHYHINRDSPAIFHEMWRKIGEYNSAANFIDVRFFENQSREMDSILIRDKLVFESGNVDDMRELYKYSITTYDKNYLVWYEKYKQGKL